MRFSFIPGKPAPARNKELILLMFHFQLAGAAQVRRIALIVAEKKQGLLE
jgi:hypothetical protein